MFFNEDFLQYVWKFRLFDWSNLQTTDGERVEVVSPGLQNTDAGPDFQQAKIKIGDTLWAGNAEVHLTSSDWKRHGHPTDKAYENVILHVVYRDDEPVTRADGSKIPTIVLQERIAPELQARYQKLLFGEQQVIPCEKTIGTLDGIIIHNWLTRVLVERLHKRSVAVLKTLDVNRGDWEETFYQYLAANFGFKTNALPFELLARSLPQLILAKHKNNPLQIEALIFGQAGFLEDEFTDEYPLSLQKEYHFLQKKYGLKPIEKHLWKFLRLRPSNFPTIRLAQFAALINRSNHLFSKVLDIEDPKKYRDIFTNIRVNPYWNDHYLFDKKSKAASKNLGRASVDVLILNTLVLILFAYGNSLKLERYVDRSLALLEFIPAEQNNIVESFVTLGIKANTAYQTQALLELKNSYCNHKKCLQCGVGNKILNLA